MVAEIGKFLRTSGLGLICAFAVAAAPSYGAVVIVKDLTGGSNIPGLTGFSTSGDEMDGMSVTATFSTGISETVFWQATGPGAGEAAGTGWSLLESGDTFGGIWTFDFQSDGLGTIRSLVLNGNTGFTVFDTTAPDPGTPGSASGWDFTVNAGIPNDVEATYSDIVSVGANAPVGDLFHVLTLNFESSGLGTGPGDDFAFIQDTDNDARRLQAPEPGSLALLGLALAGLGIARRRATR